MLVFKEKTTKVICYHTWTLLSLCIYLSYTHSFYDIHYKCNIQVHLVDIQCSGNTSGARYTSAPV